MIKIDSNTGNMANAANIYRDKIEFFNPAIFMRLQPIGLEYDSVNDGELDYLFTMKPVNQALGDQTMIILANIAARNSRITPDGLRNIVFIAVIDVVDGKCTYKGILPLDTILDCAIVI